MIIDVIFMMAIIVLIISVFLQLFNPYFWIPCILSLIIVLGITIFCNNAKLVQEINTVPIVSIERNMTTEGHFFIGSGILQGELYYVFFKHENNGYKLDKIKADGVLIIENNNEKPGIKYIANIKKGKYFDNIINQEIQLVVPVGTILKEFKL
jgi:hypothetical protein